MLGMATIHFFKSSEENGAAKLRPDLCPLGTYGYDARCRSWYHTGKETAVADDVAPLYVTPPYRFASSELVGQSATLPLVDPRNGELVGMALLDFLSAALLVLDKGYLALPGLPILITVRADNFKNDVLVGPNFTLGVDTARVEELVVPNHWNSSSGTDFDEIATAMRDGKKGGRRFKRMSMSGSEEHLYVSYAPVNVMSYRPTNHSDFSRGTVGFDTPVFSLAFLQSLDDIEDLFKVVPEQIKLLIRIFAGVLFAIIVLALMLLVYISARVTTSILLPTIQLLKMIRSMNNTGVDKDFTLLTDKSGSQEVYAVCEMFEMLFKIIRSANVSFFCGDIENAYWVLTDALRVFRRLENERAIGIACNNLGNCMLAMYRFLEETKETQICGLSKNDIISKGTAYFREAIKLGEEAYDVFYEEQGWSGSCLVFMQHLSSRYFNRAIFLLTVKKDHKFSDEAHKLGFRDLSISKCMDVEVADQCLEVGFSVDKSELFDLMLNRIKGVLSLLAMEYEDEWGIEDQIDDALRELKIALKNESSAFFSEFSPAGRMQQLDAEMTTFFRIKNIPEKAAKIGIRMLVEDEYILQDAKLVAVKALVGYIDSSEEERFSSETREAMISFKKSIELYIGEAVMDRHSSTRKIKEMRKDSLSKSSNLMKASMVDSRRSIAVSVQQTSRGDFTMEAF
uniref:Uncharacterized protein n=1 Tax=Ditylum brightwellii TaxID=49249 RepID=A0A7S4VG51_9STRA